MNTENNEPPFDPLGPKGLGEAFKIIGTQAENHRKAAQVLIGKQNVQKGNEEYPPTKFCPICRVMHSPSGIIGDTSLTSKTCDKCQAELDNGAIAVMCPDRRYAFLHSTKLVGVRNIIELSNAQMDDVFKRQKEMQERAKENGME